MNKKPEVNYCACCLGFFEGPALVSVKFDNKVTMPISFRFCPACHQKLMAKDKEVCDEMWKRYEKVLPFEEERLRERIQQLIDEKNAANTR